ncbi:MAG: IgGFc-binding protein [Uliginosibacterium sp.]|nr:IgGFc-binding protein [Uliginosibacterium sp.]
MNRLYTLICRIVIAVAALIAGVSPSLAEPLSSEGTEFWLAFTPNIATANEESLSLVISSKEGASVTVTANPGKKSTDGVFTQSLTLAPNELKVVYFPKTLALDWNHGHLVDKNSVHVVASAPITVYGRNVFSASTDGYLGLPKQTLGQEYYLITYKQLGNWPPYAKVVATEDDTEVTFTPVNGGRTADGVAINKGDSRTLTLQQGETALFYANGEKESDISGSRIFSRKPVAVIAGQDCANIPVAVYYCDHLDEMMPPVTALGYSFIVVPTKRGIVGDYVRVVAIADGTAVYLDGQLAATLSKSEVYEFLVDSPHELKINRPALVAQFMRGSTVGGFGDPSEMLLVPSSQFLKSYHLATFQEPTSSSKRFFYNYLNVVIPSGAVSTFRIDGALVDQAASSRFQEPISVGRRSQSNWAGIRLRQRCHLECTRTALGTMNRMRCQAGWP